MVDKPPQKRTATASAEQSEIKKKRRIPIANTKASQARANAIRTAQKNAASASNPSKPPRKKQTIEPPSSAKSYHTASSSLKQRPAWDLRGRVSDMSEMYKLNMKTLGELRGFKTEYEIIKEDKESQVKEVLEHVKVLKLDLLSLERKHADDIEDLHTQQRIEYQRLEDENLNHSRRLAAREIEANDEKRRLDASLSESEKITQENNKLMENIEKSSTLFKEVELKQQQLISKLDRAEMSIADHEDETKAMKKRIESVSNAVQSRQEKLSEAHKVRDRLLEKVKHLEATKKEKSTNF